jgi:hypothetical protein
MYRLYIKLLIFFFFFTYQISLFLFQILCILFIVKTNCRNEQLLVNVNFWKSVVDFHWPFCDFKKSVYVLLLQVKIYVYGEFAYMIKCSLGILVQKMWKVQLNCVLKYPIGNPYFFLNKQNWFQYRPMILTEKGWILTGLSTRYFNPLKMIFGTSWF